MDGRNPALPGKPWNDDSSVNANKQWFPMVSVVQEFVHPQYVNVDPVLINRGVLLQK